MKSRVTACDDSQNKMRVKCDKGTVLPSKMVVEPGKRQF